VKHFAAFHEFLTSKGLASRTALIGLSRGGLYSYRFASEYPQHVAVIYGDAPVCDFKSWPGGKGKGKGSPKDWVALKKLYDFPDDEAAMAYLGNPIDILSTLFEAGIPIIHTVGDADDVVPVAENTAIMESRYRALGGTMEVIHRPGVGHHPHGLDDPTPVVKFIIEHTTRRIALP
jgi:pimeloyl-ACP methyl ester carboxylesterase